MGKNPKKRAAQTVRTPHPTTGIAFKVRNDIEVSPGACVQVPMHTDAPVYQWLAAKRQQLEQGMMLRRRTMRRNAPVALSQLPLCKEIEEEGEQWALVPRTVLHFARMAAELCGMEAELRRLGIAPEFAGITQEVWDSFHNEVVTTPLRNYGEEEEDEAGGAV